MLCPYCCSKRQQIKVTAGYLSIGQQCVHSLKESRIQHIGLIHNEGNLLILATRAAQHCTQVLIKVLPGVFSVYLKTHR